MKQTWKAGNMLYPAPAVMVSCQRAGEKPNIITVAWAGTICSDPAMVSISIRKERYSHDIIAETREFVINLTTKKLCRATDYCGVRSGRSVDKFHDMHLTADESEKILAPGIAESPVSIECKVKQVLKLGSHDMFVAEVVAVRVDKEFIDQRGTLRLEKADLMAYSHGSYYELGKTLGKFGFSVQKKGNSRSDGRTVTRKPIGTDKNLTSKKSSEGKSGEKSKYKKTVVNKNSSRKNGKYSGNIKKK